MVACKDGGAGMQWQSVVVKREGQLCTMVVEDGVRAGGL